jgi:pimeloyl-ACP methyl ester carboxylesterase
MSSRQIVGPDNEHAVLHDLGGEGPPLLFTHGNGLNAGMWATVVPHLRSHFHCYGLDFRGHGASRPINTPLDVARFHFIDEILQAVDTIAHDGPIAAVGHSLGGATLVHAEHQRPGTFSKLFVFEPVIVPDTFQRPDGDHPLVIASRRRRMQFDSFEAAYDRFMSKPPYSGCDPAAVRAYVELGTYPDPEGGVRLSCSGETEANIYSSGTDTDFAGLAEITCPIAVARGLDISEGNDMPPLMAPLIAEALGNGTLVEMQGLTHFGPMEDGEATAAAILQHL